MCICTTLYVMRFSILHKCVLKYANTLLLNLQAKLGQNLNQAAAAASKIPVLVHPSTTTQVCPMASLRGSSRFSCRIRQIVSRVQSYFAPCVLQTTLTPTRHEPFHSPHYKTWYACEVQAALCHAIRGNMYAVLTLTSA